jgi:hypothetical protein
MNKQHRRIAARILLGTLIAGSIAGEARAQWVVRRPVRVQPPQGPMGPGPSGMVRPPNIVSYPPPKPAPMAPSGMGMWPNLGGYGEADAKPMAASGMGMQPEIGEYPAVVSASE